jgi:hypothetical protein
MDSKYDRKYARFSQSPKGRGQPHPTALPSTPLQPHSQLLLLIQMKNSETRISDLRVIEAATYSGYGNRNTHSVEVVIRQKHETEQTKQGLLWVSRPWRCMQSGR